MECIAPQVCRDVTIDPEALPFHYTPDNPRTGYPMAVICAWWCVLDPRWAGAGQLWRFNGIKAEGCFRAHTGQTTHNTDRAHGKHNIDDVYTALQRPDTIPLVVVCSSFMDGVSWVRGAVVVVIVHARC